MGERRTGWTRPRAIDIRHPLNPAAILILMRHLFRPATSGRASNWLDETRSDRHPTSAQRPAGMRLSNYSANGKNATLRHHGSQKTKLVRTLHRRRWIRALAPGVGEFHKSGTRSWLNLAPSTIRAVTPADCAADAFVRPNQGK
ncbi:MAG: hypothetical protein WDO73_29215 [Ignavibacteriota bacterium]